MTSVRSYGVGQYRAGEAHLLIAPRVLPPGRPLCIFHHGRGNVAGDFVLSPNLALDRIAEAGVPLLIIDQGGALSWGNSAARASINDAWAWGIANLGVRADKVLHYCGSMGNLPCWNWIADNPGKTLGLVSSLPTIDLVALHNNPTYTTEIETAYGGAAAYAAAETASDPNQRRAAILTGLGDAPVQLWYSTNDPLAPAATVESFADAVGIGLAERHNMGAAGHTFLPMDKQHLANFLARAGGLR